MSGATLNRAKLREAIHFVTRKYALTPEKLGAVKLQKILWYFEVKSATHTGEPSLGATFIKGNFGPYTLDVKGALADLVKEDRLHASIVEFFDNDKAQFVGRGQTDTSVFSERETRWLEQISADICESHTAGSISERTHGPIWQMAQFGEEIPLGAAIVRLIKPSAEDVELTRKELGLA